jgi:hypothetical protein
LNQRLKRRLGDRVGSFKRREADSAAQLAVSILETGSWVTELVVSSAEIGHQAAESVVSPLEMPDGHAGRHAARGSETNPPVC